MPRITDDRYTPPAPQTRVEAIREKLADAIRPKSVAAPDPLAPALPVPDSKPPRKPSWFHLITDDVIRSIRSDDI